MKIIKYNKDGQRKVFVNDVDFSEMSEDFKMANILKLIAKSDLEEIFLSLIKEKDFEMTSFNDDHGTITILNEK